MPAPASSAQQGRRDEPWLQAVSGSTDLSATDLSATERRRVGLPATAVLLAAELDKWLLRR